MTYSDILKEMKHHGMDDFYIERYEVEAVARNKYLIHIIFDSEKKKELKVNNLKTTPKNFKNIITQLKSRC